MASIVFFPASTMEGGPPPTRMSPAQANVTCTSVFLLLLVYIFTRAIAGS